MTVSFLLPTPADGRIWVDVTALDANGRAVADVYRELAVGGGHALIHLRAFGVIDRDDRGIRLGNLGRHLSHGALCE